MKIERIQSTKIDFGVGVLRGVLSRSDITLTDRESVEAAIEHTRAAARLVERLQRSRVSAQRRSARSARRSRG